MLLGKCQQVGRRLLFKIFYTDLDNDVLLGKRSRAAERNSDAPGILIVYQKIGSKGS